MIPNVKLLNATITSREYPSRTYNINIPLNRMDGFTDEQMAVAQAVYLILGTERYEFPIYSWDYGVELSDLFGKPMPYVISELERRIKDALSVDNRISDVVDFDFEQDGTKLHVRFTVVSASGDIPAELEVNV